MTHTNIEALSDAEWQMRAEALAESIYIDQDDVRADTKLTDAWHGILIANGREIIDFAKAFALSRRSASNTGGVEVKARQALAVYGKWAVDVATLGELGDLEARMTTVGLTLQDVGKWSNPPSLAVEAEPVTESQVDMVTGVMFDRLGLTRFGFRLEDVKGVARTALASINGGRENG